MANHLKASPQLHDTQPHYLNSDIAIHAMIQEMILYFVSSSEFRDKFFFEHEIPIRPYGQFSQFRCERIDCEFSYGFSSQGFFLESYLRHPEHIKKMGDDFWLELSSLSRHGKFAFKDNAGFSSSAAIEATKRFRAHSSTVFALIRNTVLFEVFEPDGLQDLGSLVVRWPLGTPWMSILENGLFAFRTLYKLNYLLYRAEYVQSRRSPSPNKKNS